MFIAFAIFIAFAAGLLYGKSKLLLVNLCFISGYATEFVDE